MDTITKIIAKTNVEIYPVKNTPVKVPIIPPIITYGAIFQSMFFL